jgi:hypothetical protein
MHIDLSRFKAARESRIDAGGFGFTIRRPTALEVVRAAAASESLTIDRAIGYVTNWHGVKEIDLLPGGVPEEVDFNAEVFALWVADRPELWGPIVSGVIDAYQSYEQARADRGNV